MRSLGSSRRALLQGAAALPAASLFRPYSATSRAWARGPVFDDVGSLRDALRTARAGQSIAARGRYVLDDVLTVPDGVALEGSLRSPEIGAVGEDVRQRMSLIELGPNGRIELGRGSFLGGLTILRAGIRLPYRTPEEALAGMRRWGGTALVIGESGCTVSSCLLVGFERVADGDLRGNGRITFTDVKFDCLNGIRLRGSLDSNRVYRSHGWPYATAHLFTGAPDRRDPSVNLRPGVGFEFADRSDGTVVVDCLAYGYETGFRIKDASVKLSLGWADANASAGIEVVGSCEGTEIHATTSVANGTALVVDTGATPPGRPVRMFGGVCNARTIGIHHKSGELAVDGTTLERATSVQVEDAVRSTRITDCTMRSGGGIVVPSGSPRTHARIVARQNRYDETPPYAFEIGGPAVTREAVPRAEQGSFATATAQIRVRQIEGMLVFVQAKVAIVRNGSATGRIRLALPFEAAVEAGLTARVAETGEPVSATIPERGSDLILGARDASAAGARTILVSGMYERI